MAQAGKSQTVTVYIATLPKERGERGEAIHQLVKNCFQRLRAIYPAPLEIETTPTTRS